MSTLLPFRVKSGSHTPHLRTTRIARGPDRRDRQPARRLMESFELVHHRGLLGAF